MNYTIQDILGIFLAFGLFPLCFVFPGYVTGFALDLFQFRTRRSIVQFGIALWLSASIGPIVFFLAYRLLSYEFALLLALVFAIVSIVIQLRTQDFILIKEDIKKDKFGRMGFYILIIWFVVVTFFLVDLQFDNRLYYNIVAYDYSTRVSVINAITRTGVPPVNPSYFPGSPQPLTQVYYFWYILCSFIDQIGGRLVDAHSALIASVIWTGLILASGVAFFTRLRNTNKEKSMVWRLAFMGIGFLLVSGLDIFPSSFYILFPKLLIGRIFEGDIEQWNEQITAWIGAVTWTPHHVVSTLACVLAWALIASSRTEDRFRQISVSFIAGLALASSFGLSVWLTLIFIIFWIVWFVIQLVQRNPLNNMLTMILPGVFMLVALLPFLLDLLSGSNGSGTGGQFPLALNVRSFYPLEFIGIISPAWQRMLIYLLALPLNYFLELGFFFLVGIIWFQNCRNEQKVNNPLAKTEILLFLVTATLVTFMRSTVIVNNDFGWRGWLFGQFILVFWGADVIQLVQNKITSSKIIIFQTPRSSERIKRLLSILIVIGVVTTMYDVFFLRTWPMWIDTGIAGFPRVLSPDNHLGERTFAMRNAYAFLEDNTPDSSIVQFDPRHTIDRPAGLYRTRGSVISYHTLYGVSEQTFKPLIDSVGSIFDTKEASWQFLDNACRRYNIDILILRDLDPIWPSLKQLRSARTPLYENRFTALFECSNGVP